MSFASFDSQEDQFINEINMTPFVDVMLVLLIIFMITVPVLKNSVEMDLPQASSKPQEHPPEVLSLSIDRNGEYVIDKRRLDEDGLSNELQRIAKSKSKTVLHIYGDKKVEYDHVARAMSIAHSAGIEKVGFVTTPKEK